MRHMSDAETLCLYENQADLISIIYKDYKEGGHKKTYQTGCARTHK